MSVIHTQLNAPWWLPNGHLQSIFPSMFRKVVVPYEPERIETDDDDFLDLNWCCANNKRLVILTHGLEGDSMRQYITGMVRLLVAHNYDVLAWNYRSCGGQLNRQVRTYHSGETTDIARVIAHAMGKGYEQIYLMGYSLGGNVTLKYLGEQGVNLPPAIKKAVVFSVPMDLAACSQNIGQSRNRVYAWRFLRTLKPKILAKAQQHPDKIDGARWQEATTIYLFDDIFTGPIHGFLGADDYYARSSSMHFVDKITIPTLIVNAKNDPLVPYESLPVDKVSRLEQVTLELTNTGGHCGFRPSHLPPNQAYWSETRALKFLNS